MLLFPNKRKPITSFTPDTNPLLSDSDSDLFKKGMSMIDQYKKTLSKYGTKTPSITTIPTGGFAGRNQIGGQSGITIIRNPTSTAKIGSTSTAKIGSGLKTSVTSSARSSYVDDGKGPAMSESARIKFIKGKNPDYTVKKTPQGATYGVRQIV